MRCVIWLSEPHALRSGNHCVSRLERRRGRRERGLNAAGG